MNDLENPVLTPEQSKTEELEQQLEDRQRQIRLLKTELMEARRELTEAKKDPVAKDLEIHASFQKLAQLLINDFNNGAIEGNVCAIFMDLNNFKSLNDTFGHVKGDQVLSFVGKAVVDSIRASDLAGRVGGDEIMVLLPETTPEQAVIIAKRLRGAINLVNRAGIVENNDHPISASIGIAQLKKGENYDQFKVNADQAMYHAKKSNPNTKDQVALFLGRTPIGEPKFEIVD